jgi:hypothetical protein
LNLSLNKAGRLSAHLTTDDNIMASEASGGNSIERPQTNFKILWIKDNLKLMFTSSTISKAGDWHSFSTSVRRRGIQDK